MSKLVKVSHGRSVIAIALASAAGALLAGCSSDTSGLNPFQNSARFAGTDRASTGSIVPPEPIGQARAPAPMVSAAPTSRVASMPLAPVRSIPASPASSYAAPSYSSYPSVAHSRPPVSHAVASVTTDHGVWSADGGTMILVHPGENAATIATRYNVPLEVLVHVNGLVSAAQVHPGARVVIPVYSATSGVSAHSAMSGVGRSAPSRGEIARSEPPKQTESGRRQVASADARGHETFHFVKGPSGAPPAEEKQARAGERSVRDIHAAPDGRLAKASAGAKADVHAHSRVAEAQIKSLPAPMAHSSSNPAGSSDRLPPSRDMDRTATASLPPTGVEADVEPRDGFRWPVHGRIIAGFKQGSNEGINIAVPDGTNVKAADDGVVAYAGSELKGYGNLVLIRHPNGFVTAYANNGEIDVKRGEVVKRGQVIAKSGASGNVSSPQLHFELRKGQTPVDPTTFLDRS